MPRVYRYFSCRNQFPSALTLFEMGQLPRAHGFEVIGQAPSCVIRRAHGFSGQRALTVLAEGVERRAFPGAAFAVHHNQEIVLQGAVGRFTYDEGSEDVTLSTVYDLASVTKVVATTATAMLLHQRGNLDLKLPAVELLPEFRAADARRKQVTVEMLLAHSSGLPAYVKLFQQAQTRATLLELCFRVPLEVSPATRSEYSDIGFILLGELLQRLTHESLDTFCAREIFDPLNMKSTRFCPAAQLRGSIPPTRNDQDFRHRVIQGEVHDENASVMGGVAGHAGAFGNTADLVKFSASSLGQGPQLFLQETIDLFTHRRSSPAGTSRALGWDTPSAPSQSGKYFSPHSFGHLGYSGTSLWIDGERGIAIALLTNRTWPDNQSKLIKQIRPQFHDAVMEELLKIG
jgi:CubicO group peptidase (beta-lactamase class C family)